MISIEFVMTVRFLFTFFLQCLCNIHCCGTGIQHNTVPILHDLADQICNMLFSHNIAVLPDIERQFNIYIFINDSSAIAFNA